MNEKLITPGDVRGAKFKMTTHINGGSKFSELHYRNDEWGIVTSTLTDGSPSYIIKEKILFDPVSKAEVDLLEATEFKENLQEFCDKYNEARS